MRHCTFKASLSVYYVGLFIVSALVTGCNGRNDTQAASKVSSYTVTFFNGGKVPRQWEAKRCTSTAGFGRLWMYMDGQSEPLLLCGTYVLEPKAAVVTATVVAPASSARYKVSLYSNGEVVRTILVRRFNISSDGKLYLLPEVEGEAIVVSGTFVVEPVAHSRVADEPGRAIVSLYSGAGMVRTWTATRYSAATAKLYIWVSGSSEPIVASGDYLIAPTLP